MYRAASDLQSDPLRFAAAATAAVAAATTIAIAVAFSCATKRTTCPELSPLRVDLTYDAPVERYFNDTLLEYCYSTFTSQIQFSGRLYSWI